MNRIISFCRENTEIVGAIGAGLSASITDELSSQFRNSVYDTVLRKSGFEDLPDICLAACRAALLSKSLFKIDQSILKYGIGVFGFMANEVINTGVSSLPYWANRTISLLAVGGALNLLLDQRINKNLFIAAAAQFISFQPAAFFTLLQDGMIGISAGASLGYFLFKRDAVINLKELTVFTVLNSTIIASRFFNPFNPLPQLLESIAITALFSYSFFSMYHDAASQDLIDENADLAQENSELREDIEELTNQRNNHKAQAQMRSLPNTVSSWYDKDPILSKFSCLITQTPCVAPVADPDGNSLYEKDQILHWLQTKKTSPANRLPLEAAQLKDLPKLNDLIQFRLQCLKNACEQSQQSLADCDKKISEAHEEMKKECPELVYLFADLLPNPVPPDQLLQMDSESFLNKN